MMTMALADRPFLGSVRSALTDRIRFCSRCGMTREERELRFNPPDTERVCADCGMGVMLVCERDATLHVAVDEDCFGRVATRLLKVARVEVESDSARRQTPRDERRAAANVEAARGARSD